MCVFACLCFLHLCVCVIMYGCRYVGLLVGGIRWHLEDLWKDADAFGSIWEAFEKCLEKHLGAFELLGAFESMGDTLGSIRRHGRTGTI